MTDLPSMMSMSICDEGWPLRWRRRRRARCGNNDGDVTVRGLLGLVLVCVLGIFFFFFYKHLFALCLVCCVLCVWFAFVLGFDLSANNDATWWDSARRQQHDGFNFWFSFSFFFFWVENLWACREQATCNGLAVGLACRGLLGLVLLFYLNLFFQILVQIFFWGFFFFFLAWK